MEMMSIEDEIIHIKNFLSHPAGFNVEIFGILGIRPTDENCPPGLWEVNWEDVIDNVSVSSYKEFHSLEDAVRFFVEKRHFKCLGIDFEYIINKE